MKKPSPQLSEVKFGLNGSHIGSRQKSPSSTWWDGALSHISIRSTSPILLSAKGGGEVGVHLALSYLMFSLTVAGFGY